MAQVVAISCGSSHTVALLDCDIVVSFGRGEDGQLGHGDAAERLTPEGVKSLANHGIDCVYCGAEYSFALSRTHRKVYSWGWGDFGRLGHGDSRDVFIPEPIVSLSGLAVASVACGDTHTLVAIENGDLYSFGRNQNGQLGLGNNNDALTPCIVGTLQGKKVVRVSCGAEHSLAATDTGEVFAWGWGRYGNLGDGQLVDRRIPTQVKGLDGVRITSVACGWRHNIVCDDQGCVYTFGWSRYGQLGHGDNRDQLIPKRLEALSDVKLIAGGWRHTAAAGRDGKLYAWGWNKFGQLGIGTTEDVNAPALVESLAAEKVSLLACGWRHTVSVTEGGNVYAWGRGVNGQLGFGEAADRYTPERVKTLCKGEVDVEALKQHSSTLPAAVQMSDRYAIVPDPHKTNGGMSVPEIGEPLQKRSRS